MLVQFRPRLRGVLVEDVDRGTGFVAGAVWACCRADRGRGGRGADAGLPSVEDRDMPGLRFRIRSDPQYIRANSGGPAIAGPGRAHQVADASVPLRSGDVSAADFYGTAGGRFGASVC